MAKSYEIRDKFIHKINLMVTRLSEGKDITNLSKEVVLSASEYDSAIMHRMEEIEADNLELTISNYEMTKRWDELVTKLGLMGVNAELILMIDYPKLLVDKYNKKINTNYKSLKLAVFSNDYKTIEKCITK